MKPKKVFIHLFCKYQISFPLLSSGFVNYALGQNTTQKIRSTTQYIVTLKLPNPSHHSHSECRGNQSKTLRRVKGCKGNFIIDVLRNARFRVKSI